MSASPHPLASAEKEAYEAALARGKSFAEVCRALVGKDRAVYEAVCKMRDQADAETAAAFTRYGQALDAAIPPVDYNPARRPVPAMRHDGKLSGLRAAAEYAVTGSAEFIQPHSNAA